MGSYMFIARSIPCILFFLASGCAHLPLAGVLPDNARITEITVVDGDSPFALAAGGKMIAFVNGGLRLTELTSGNERPISADVPTALAWSADGKQLAAAFSLEQETVLRLYDSQGNFQSQARLGGRVCGLAWRSSSTVLALAVKQQVYTFGANLAGILYHWDGKGEPTLTSLYETTLMPALLRRWERVLQRTLTFAISPLDDEILYARLYAPPAFTPYLKLILRNLENGTEREVATASLLSAGGVFTRDGEQIIYGDGESESRLIDPWGDRTVSTFPSPGRATALSPSGRYLLLDGHLYRDGREIASFPANSVGAFSPDGGRLALRYRERLYLVTGLSEEPAAPRDPARDARLRQLHKWLSEGLITSREYIKTLEKAAQ